MAEPLPEILSGIQLEYFGAQSRMNEHIRKNEFLLAGECKELMQNCKARMEEIKQQCLENIRNFSVEHQSLDYFARMHTLLMMFQPVDFAEDVEGSDSLTVVKETVNGYWLHRKEMLERFTQFIENEYRKHMRERVQYLHNNNDAAASISLRCLHYLGEFLAKYKM